MWAKLCIYYDYYVIILKTIITGIPMVFFFKGIVHHLDSFTGIYTKYLLPYEWVKYNSVWMLSLILHYMTGVQTHDL